MDKPQMVEAAVMRPGDKVLLAIPDEGYDSARLAEMADQLRAEFPDARFVFVACSGMAVQRGR